MAERTAGSRARSPKDGEATVVEVMNHTLVGRGYRQNNVVGVPDAPQRVLEAVAPQRGCQRRLAGSAQQVERVGELDVRERLALELAEVFELGVAVGRRVNLAGRVSRRLRRFPVTLPLLVNKETRK